MKSNKKIMAFIIALLIVAGIVVICLKGFNVSLELRSHDVLKYIFDQKFDKNDVNNICKDVFGDSEFKIKKVEVFSDAVYIIAPTISEEQEKSLLEKLDALYKEQEKVVENESTEEIVDDSSSETIFDKLVEGTDYAFYSDAKVRIRDIVKPYIQPSIIFTVIVFIYIAIKYRKLNNENSFITVIKTIFEMLVILSVIVSIIAICRIPFTTSLIPIIIFIMMICLVIKMTKFEKDLLNLED